MKFKHVIIAMAMLILPATTLAVSSNSQGQSSNTVINSNGANSNSQSGTANQAQNQIQTNNAGESTNIRTQAQEEAQIAAKVKETAPKYVPENSKSAEHKSEVAKAVQALIQTSYQLENTGLGDQIRTIAQTQSQNQDKIGEAVDNADKRSSFAKFFIGANYSELKEVKTVMEQNQNQIEELMQVMTQLDNEGDKLEIANQIIVLQNTQLELKEQLNDLTSGFSLFGWISRWRNNY